MACRLSTIWGPIEHCQYKLQPRARRTWPTAGPAPPGTKAAVNGLIELHRRVAHGFRKPCRPAVTHSSSAAADLPRTFKHNAPHLAPRRTRRHRRIGAWHRRIGLVAVRWPGCGARSSPSVCARPRCVRGPLTGGSPTDRGKNGRHPGLRAAAPSGFAKIQVLALVECGTHAWVVAVRQRAETRRPSAGGSVGGHAAAGRPGVLRVPAVTRSHRDGRRPAVAGQQRRGAAGALNPGRRPLPRPLAPQP